MMSTKPSQTDLKKEIERIRQADVLVPNFAHHREFYEMAYQLRKNQYIVMQEITEHVDREIARLQEAIKKYEEKDG